MNYGDSQRIKRITIIILIIIVAALIYYFITNSIYKKSKIIENNCTENFEKCICLGTLTKETTTISYISNPQENFTCTGFEQCWKINETICP